ncbi:hypothetical protein GCM10022407_14740 [Hymenobacter antarcticus]|uniref:Uncharacterized protein n=1 Tax=Hymenobacter antarcticus TaxID=486270 RepID=A0ABP7PRK7_9BACT
MEWLGHLLESVAQGLRKEAVVGDFGAAGVSQRAAKSGQVTDRKEGDKTEMDISPRTYCLRKGLSGVWPLNCPGDKSSFR